MARVQGMVDADWTVDRATKVVAYIGDDHTLSGGSPSYATVIQFHRWIQEFADQEAFDAGGVDTDDVEMDIIDINPTTRSTDNIIQFVNGYTVTAVEIEHLYDGTIIQGTGITEERWDGIVNFGNATAHLQVLQDSAIIADDFWNYGHEAGSETGGGSATIMTDSTLGATVDEFIGYTIINVTDGSRGIITDNDATTVTVAELYGGTLDTWTTADVHHIAIPLNPDAGQGISSRWMLKTRDEGVDIDRRRLIGTSRRYGNTFSEFKINGTSQGNNVFALADAGDLNNTTSWATIDALADITNTEGLRLLDIAGDGSANEEYYSEWTRGANTINIFYEYMKMSTADATAETLQAESGELHRGPTHSFPYDLETGVPVTTTNVKHVYGTMVNTGVVTSGPFVVGEVVRETGSDLWRGRVLGVDTVGTSLIVDIRVGTVGNAEAMIGDTSGATASTSSAPTGLEIQNSAGECKVLALDDDGATGNFYVQTIKGVGTLDNTRVYEQAEHTKYYECSADATERAISTPFVGVSTGSALIGAYGLGMLATDTTSAETFFQLSDPTPITPPNTVTFVASGFLSGDYVLCTEDNAGDINLGQMTLATDLTGAAETLVVVVSIPTDTPLNAGGTLGGIRIQRNTGLYSLHRYTSFDQGSDTFTIPASDFATADDPGNGNATGAKNVFVSYIDLVTASSSEQFSYVYGAGDRTHFLRVRNGDTPIKTAEATGVMTTTGGVASVSTIPDA
jgi:hypothetical protein